MNNVTLIGNLGREVETRDVAGGRVVGTTVVAVSRVWKGQKVGTDWIPLVLWDRLAVNAARHLHKGSRVAIDGRLRGGYVPQRSGEADGRPSRLRVEVVVERITYLSPRPSAEQPPAGPAPRSSK